MDLDTPEFQGAGARKMTTSMWFNSDIWFEMESIGQVTTYPHKTVVFTNTRDVITITIQGNSATVKRQRGDNVVVYTLGSLHVRYNVNKLIEYAKKHNIYMNVTDRREFHSPIVVEGGQTKDYKGIAKTEVVRGYENLYPYARITALVLPDGAVRLMRFGNRTYKVAEQVRYPDWDEFVKANKFVDEIPDEEDDMPALVPVDETDLSSVTADEEDIQEVNVPEEDEDSSSDYEPEAEREFYRSQTRAQKRRRVEKTMTIRMAVGGGDDENIDQKLVEVEFHFSNLVHATKASKLYSVVFQNGARMILGKGSITYTRSNGESVWAEWVKPSDFNDLAVWLWDHPSFARPEVVA